MEREKLAARALILLSSLAFLAAPPSGAAMARMADVQARHLTSEGLKRLQKSDYDAAISSLNRAVRGRGSVSAYFLLGWAHYQRGFKSGSVDDADRADARAAIDAYEAALKRDPALAELPDPSRLYFSLALCREVLGQPEEAIAAYNMALKKAPGRALIPLQASRLRLKMRDSDRSLADLELAVRKARAAGQEKSLRDLVRRDPSFAALLASPAHRWILGIDAAKTVPMVALSTKNEELRDSVRDIPARVPAAKNPALLDKVAQGDAEFRFRRYQPAITAYEEALAADRDGQSLGAARTAAAYEKLGAAYNKIGRGDRALSALQKSIRNNPANSEARYQAALAYALSGKTATALEALTECFRSAEDSKGLRRYVLRSKTDTELAAVRDLPGFRAAVSRRIARR